MKTTHTHSRRNFIKTGAGFAVTAGVLDWTSPLMSAESKRLPVGCRDGHLKLPGQPDSWSSMKAIGAESAEVAVSLDLACPQLFHPDRKYTL